MRTQSAVIAVLIAIMIGLLSLISMAFWFSDGICFYRGSTYSFCAVDSVPSAMEAFGKAMPKEDK